MPSDTAAGELREAIEHIERARRLSAFASGGWADRKLAVAVGGIKTVLDREFGIGDWRTGGEP